MATASSCVNIKNRPLCDPFATPLLYLIPTDPFITFTVGGFQCMRLENAEGCERLELFLAM